MDQTDHSIASETACKHRSRSPLVVDMSTIMYRDSKPNKRVSSRPHSSPVRPMESPRHHKRIHKSPSTSQSRLQEMAMASSSAGSPMDAPFIGAGEKFLSQRSPASAGMAYFAVHPPIAPMHIVVVKHNPEPDQTIPLFNAVTTSTEPRVSNNPDVATSTDSKRPPSGSEPLVRRVLQDLMTTLPLRLMSSPASQARSRSPDNINIENTQRVRSPLTPSTLQHRVSQLSARARSPACSTLLKRLSQTDFDRLSDAAHTVSEKGEGTQPEDWVGGVRALRDSHVRLVLRQLRHIERLNRALDRFSKQSTKR